MERELDIIAGIKRGLADMKAERLVTHDEAMQRLRGTIARARGTKKGPLYEGRLVARRSLPV
jgi:predicted transcriptional regulator